MEPGIRIDKKLLRSEAFRSLSRWGLLVYLDFLRKRQMDPLKKKGQVIDWLIGNNGEIIYPYDEAEQKNIPRSSFRNALDELIGNGLLDINHRGSGGKKGDVTTYYISERWKKFGQDDFKPPLNPRPRDERRGRGWAVIMDDPARKKEVLKKRSKTLEKRRKKQS
jgi:hypothetical protein